MLRFLSLLLRNFIARYENTLSAKYLATSCQISRALTILTKVDVTEQWTAYPILGDQEGEGTDYQHGSVVAPVKVDSVVVPSHFQGGGYALGFNIGETVYELRIANRVYLAITAEAGFSPGFELLVSGPASGQAIRQAPLSPGLTRGTANPITGTLVIDRENPVAFI